MKPLLLSISLAISVALLPPVGGAPLAGREWTDGNAVWREDPRPPADAPFEAEVPRGRRATRRSQRRVTTQRMPLDGIPIDAHTRLPAGAVPRPILREVPQAGIAPGAIPFETTLGPLSDASLTPGGVDAQPTLPQNSSRDEPIAHRDQPSVPQPDSRQRFDIFLPAGCSGGGRLPLVIWVHGDSWRDGSKADCPIRWLAEQGYAVASIGYRLSDKATFPAQLDDCRAAVDALARNAEVWGIDRDRIAIIGAGGGGHLAALVGLSTEAAAGVAPGPDAARETGATRVAALCVIGAPAHLTTLGPAHDRPSSPASLLIGGPLPEFRELAQQASPLAHVSADDPPSLIIHGDRDEQVPIEQSIRLDAALQAAGIDSTLLVLENVGHKPALDRGSPAGRALLEFLDRTLEPGVNAAGRREPGSQPAPALAPHSDGHSVVVPTAR